MTGLDDYCLRKIKTQNQPEVRIEIAASQLLLFGNEFPLNIRLQLLEMLIVNLVEVGTSYDSLAVLVAIHEIKSLDKGIVRRELPYILGKIADQIESHEALRIFSAFVMFEEFASENGRITSRMELSPLTTRPSSGLNALYGQSPSKPATVYSLNSWFKELYDDNGHLHSRPITLFIDLLNNKKIQKDGIKISDMETAITCLDRFYEIVVKHCLGQDPALIREEEWNQIKTILKEIEELYKNARNALQSLSGELQAKYSDLSHELNEWKAKRETVLTLLVAYRDKMIKAADGVFVRICKKERNDDDKRYGRYRFESQFLQSLISNLKKDNKLDDKKLISCSHTTEDNDFTKKSEVWIIWTNEIQILTKDLLGNVRHASEQIPDPYDLNSSKDHPKADMWFQVHYDSVAVKINCINAVNCMDAVCFRENKFAQMKKKGRWFELEDMGGRIRLMSEEEVSSLPNEILKNMPLFCVQVEIPYAGHLHMKRDMT